MTKACNATANDAPERIWATGNATTGSWNNVDARHCPGTEYIRADHAQAELQAAVAAEREACALVCDEYSKDHGSGMFDRHSNECANRIRARTDTDSQAALEAVKREARNEALMEVVVKVESHIDLVSSSSPTKFALDWVRDDVLALMGDTDDDK